MPSLLSMQFRESVSKHKDYRMKLESDATISYPTGFLNFDFMNGNVVHVQNGEKNTKYYSVGIQDGCLVMLIGRSGCGKTTWAFQTACNIIRNFPNSTVFYDDIEGGCNPDRRLTLSGMTPEQLEDRCIYRNTGVTAENFYERLRNIHDLKLNNRAEYEYDTGMYDYNGKRIYKLQPTVYILDSVALLMPAQYTEEEELSGSMSATAAAKTNSMSFKRIIPMLKAANIILFAINHINKKIDINPMQRTKSQVAYLKQDESLPGGNTIIYLTNILIRFDDNSKLKPEEGFGIDGNLVDISLIKSRNNRAGKVCTLVFNKALGYDPELTLFLMLKNAKKINGAGAYLYIGNLSDIKFAQKNFKQKLREYPELRQAFINEAITVLKEDLDSSDSQTSEGHMDYSLSTDIMNQINADL